MTLKHKYILAFKKSGSEEINIELGGHSEAPFWFLRELHCLRDGTNVLFWSKPEGEKEEGLFQINPYALNTLIERIDRIARGKIEPEYPENGVMDKYENVTSSRDKGDVLFDNELTQTIKKTNTIKRLLNNFRVESIMTLKIKFFI